MPTKEAARSILTWLSYPEAELFFNLLKEEAARLESQTGELSDIGSILEREQRLGFRLHLPAALSNIERNLKYKVDHDEHTVDENS